MNLSHGIGSIVDATFYEYKKIQRRWWHKEDLYNVGIVYQGHYHETISGVDYDGMIKLLQDVLHFRKITYVQYSKWYLDALKR